MRLRTTLFDVYRALEKRIAPGLKYSQYLYEDVLNSHVNGEVDWLDVGCGHRVLPPWRAEEEKSLVGRSHSMVGLDADWASLRKHRSAKAKVLGTICQLPFRDGSFDMVTANMVVEHLDKPATQFREISRILKPGGVFIFHTPNRRGYLTMMARAVPEWAKNKLIYLLEARAEGDVFRTFHRVNTPEEITQVAEASGFEVRQLRMVVTSGNLVVFPPLVVFELIWIRVLMSKRFKRLRTNIIAVLQKR
jgi:ubiquinone/menaquinone biosynthesis C-methylase UbiE